LREGETTIENLDLMLEGQVAILSSGMLPPEEALALLQSLRHSALYRADQHSYLLYPNRQLPGFLAKNNIPAARVQDSALVAALTAAGDRRLITRDVAGIYHFNGDFRNAGDVVRVLNELAQEPTYAVPVAAERPFILDLFESVFDHSTFTGRSGTFFAYEGLGSVYWHMVSKLLLATQGCYQYAVDGGADPALIAALDIAYYDIRQGLGFNKSPAAYGAFPTDPYSHTPEGGGASQPGMTGQVKEEIIARFGELGVFVRQGALCFAPGLLRENEFLHTSQTFSYIDVTGQLNTMSLAADSLAFTICQTPVNYVLGDQARLEVTFADGHTLVMPDLCLDVATSQSIFNREGQVTLLRVTFELSSSL